MEDLQDKIIELMDLFDGEVTTANKVDIPKPREDVQTIEAINRFMRDNPPGKADGGRIGFKGGYKVEDMTPEEIKAAQGNARKKGYSGKIGSEEFKNFLANEYRSRAEQLQDFKKLKQKNLKEYQEKFDIDKIKTQTTPLLKSQKDKLFPTYDNIFKEEFARLSSTGDPFSRTDLGRAVVNRIEAENPTINVSKGIGLDKIPGGGNHGSKTIFDIINGRFRKNKLFSKKELALFTQGNETDALVKTKNLQLLFEEILNGNTDKTSLAEKFKVFEERIDGRVEKLMRNLAITNVNDRFTFLKNYKEKDLEKVRNNIYESESLNSSYQRTIVQSVLESTKLGSKERAQAFEKLEEFNKFKAVMRENGLDPKLLALDHAASYRAIKNGNLKNFLSVTPIMADINTIKSTFDRRSQLNLRRMQDAINSGDNASYKKFLKNQTELEGIWKTMTGDKSSLGKIRVQPGGKAKGVVKIFDYGATSILEKDKNLINELADNLKIRQNIVNASTPENFQEVSRIMFEGSEAVKPKASILPESFTKLNDPKMFAQEKKINDLILNYAATITDQCAVNLPSKKDGGRIGFKLGSDDCFKIGKKGLDDGLTKGFKNKQQINLAETILRAGGGLKSAFALRNIFGPAAIAATVAFEGGLIGYDMLTSGKTLREAFGDNLLNYALGKDYQIDPQEELFKRFKGLGYDNQQIGSIKRALDAMNTINTGAQLAMNVGQQQEALQKSRGQPETFMIPDDQMMADTAGQRAEQNLKDARERLTAFNQSLEAVDRPGGMKKEDVLSEYFSSGKYAEDLDLFNQAEKEANIQKLESALPTAFGKVFPKFEERRQEGLADLRSIINPAFNIPGARDATFIPGKTTGGLFGLAEGGRAGYKLGKVVKVKPSKVRSDAKSIIDENIKLMKQMKETGEIDEISSDLNQVIKKALDEDLFDKKDRIVDSINISEAKKRRNYPYNMQVFEEPKNLDFYRDIKESNFKTKTGEYFDRIRRRNKAGGGLLKQAGDRSGPPPESGPNPQGLQGLLNRVKKV
jgi:hypothetical protein